jgi:hypothetical protein
MHRMEKVRKAIAVSLLTTCAIGTAHAATFTVSNTNNSGAGSLRQAILDANAAGSCVMQTITFAIPGTGVVHTIRPTSPLPALSIPTTLDGYSQPGAQQNSLITGENAKLLIELDGSLAGISDGIVVAGNVPLHSCSGNGSLISGLVINRFQSAGILAQGTTCSPGQFCNVGGIIAYGNFIGTDPTGLIAEGNGFGVYFGVNSDFDRLGDEAYGSGGSFDPQPFTRNIISGNVQDGVYVGSTSAGFPATDVFLRNNYIGVDATGTQPLGNGGHGIFFDVGSGGAQIADNIIGASGGDGVHIESNANGYSMLITSNGIGVGIGDAAVGNAGDGVYVSGTLSRVSVAGQFHYRTNGTRPAISHNGGAGVFVEGNASVDVVAGVAGNGGLGIDLAPRGVNANDALDADTGPNELLNAPVLLPPTAAPSSMVNVLGSIDTNPSTMVGIDIYYSDTCDASGHGPGQVVVSSLQKTTDAAGHADFSKPVSIPPNKAVTAVTRRSPLDPDQPGASIVSEFSNCQIVGDDIFADGFGP